MKHIYCKLGDNFRPAFRSFSDILASVENVVAMTATSKAATMEEITKTLNMHQPKVIRCSTVLNDNISLHLGK